MWNKFSIQYLDICRIFSKKGGSAVPKPLYKPGEDNKPRGEYVEVGPRGGQVHDPRQVTIDPGDRLPPTQKPGNKWTPKK